MLDVLNQIMNDGLKKELTHQFTEDERLDGSAVNINGDALVNFGSCSYLGLEYHSALAQGVKEAVEQFGTQFSSSRAYLSIGLYRELETELTQIFENPVIATASTTLGHLAALPVLVGPDDAVVIDLQVHSSVQMAVQILKASKIKTFVVPHNDMNALEGKIKTLRDKHRKIWYLADGVYSMYGDYAPLDKLQKFLNEYKQFHLYIDDAHGMSWAGKNGVGYVRSQMEHHERMVLVSSLNKSFASSGGVLVFPNEAMKKDVQNCGSTLIFSGPIQPPMLGAAIASAKLHQSEELKDYQEDLKHKIAFTNRRLRELNLPQFMESDSPLFFIPCGLPRYISNILQRMKKQGFFLNAASFPAVPMKKGGIRFMINRNLEIADIEKMLVTLQREYVLGLEEEGSSTEMVAKTFKLKPFRIVLRKKNLVQHPAKLKAEIVHSISEIPAEEWDATFKENGTLLHSNLKALESLFDGNAKREDNWKFYYYTIRDFEGNIVLRAHYTAALIMDDMLSPASVSSKVKENRLFDPYYLTSKAVMTGSLFSKGKAVVFDTENANWKQALEMFLAQLQITAEQERASKVLVRELPGGSGPMMKDFMLEQGLVQQKVPSKCVVENLSWYNLDDFMAGMKQKYRYSLRKEILAFEDKFTVDFTKATTKAQMEQGYALYEQVYENALDISVFKLPQELFHMMEQNKGYDIMRLYLKENPEEPVAIMYSYVNNGVYNALTVGLDYRFVRSHNTYKQILFQTVKRAKALGCKQLDLAYTAEMEKKKVGATVHDEYVYSMALEHFSFALLNAVN